MTQIEGILRALALAGAALTLAAAAPDAASAQQAAAHAPSRAPAGDVVQVAAEAGDFQTLVAAIRAAGLAETLKGEGPFTVFAPSDAAFAKLPPGTVEALLADRDALTRVLTLHVVPGRVAAADVMRAGRAAPRTVNGATLDVRVRDGKVWVNGARVTSADVAASNGVIHVIDTVLLPAATPADR